MIPALRGCSVSLFPIESIVEGDSTRYIIKRQGPDFTLKLKVFPGLSAIFIYEPTSEDLSIYGYACKSDGSWQLTNNGDEEQNNGEFLVVKEGLELPLCFEQDQFTGFVNSLLEIGEGYPEDVFADFDKGFSVPSEMEL